MLTIVPTPIGNLQDITLRALEALKACDFIIAENPAHSSKLLQHFSIPKKEFIQFAEHNEQKVLPKIIEKLKTQKGCLISDAGTPGISDPGFRLVRAAVEADIAIESLPGPSAAITALAASGLPTDSFLFIGFFGKTEVKVNAALDRAETAEATLIAYDSPERVTKTVGFIAKNHPNIPLVIARELSKMHEEYIRGSAEEVYNNLRGRKTIKGEITILISLKK